ncbi:ABC-type tungstate transport system, permease protein [Methanosarcina mazei Tuc01]|uniref:ABC-type tungstate transport system, permease protein n=1 Tax=Methanosarcina mazei Tuc01 TaxID=1236903 RepID=M1Q3Y8_METMZ|nr:ABC-type tungstate transport system, permease protein [Methanosarcina mazei Tuc01]
MNEIILAIFQAIELIVELDPKLIQPLYFVNCNTDRLINIDSHWWNDLLL